MRQLLQEQIYARSIPEPNTGCWLFLGNVQGSGHGRFKVGGHTTPAHRVSWIAFRGEIPGNLLVCHACDVPSCVNPEHLFLGTCADNHADRNAKGRQARGITHGRATISAEQAIAIRSDKRPASSIRRQYGLSMSQIYRIKHGTGWRHLFNGEPIPARWVE